MGMLDALWHVLNLFAPAVAVGALASALTKLLWRKELRASSWLRMWAWSAVAGGFAALGAVVVLGHDGQMLGYGALVLACSLALWWSSFGPGRR